MKKPLISTLLVAGSLALALACRPSQTVELQTKDAGIKATLKTRLAAEVGASTVTAVEVNVTNGVVTLAGAVGSDTDRQRIAEVARTVDGVVSVNNNLQVMATAVVTPAGMEPTPMATPPGTPPAR